MSEQIRDQAEIRADRKRASDEARNAQERVRAKVHAELGVTRPESALFTALYYGITIPPSRLPEAAAMEDSQVNIPGVTQEECQVALNSCLAKGWVQVIDEIALKRIADDLREDGVLGPIYGCLPEVGCVDFTKVGAELWRKLWDGCRAHKGPPYAYLDVVHEKTTHYFRSWNAAVAARDEARKEEDLVVVTEPIPTGPWRAQWWRRFPEGYRIDIEVRRKWQGSSSGVGEECYLERSVRDTDLKRLRQVLDCHNITFTEWLPLQSMERSWSRKTAINLAGDAVKFAMRQFGVVLTEAECRNGVDACLRYGWLWVVDQRVVDDVHVILHDTPALLAVPSKAKCHPGECDFSPVGAQLYRMISAEWLGPDWEDDLRVSREYYREEHHYCVTEEGFNGAGLGHPKEAKVRARRVIPIGPWCVHWWQRFTSGFRLELEIGEP